MNRHLQNSSNIRFAFLRYVFQNDPTSVDYQSIRVPWKDTEINLLEQFITNNADIKRHGMANKALQYLKENHELFEIFDANHLENSEKLRYGLNKAFDNIRKRKDLLEF
jgi:hypothetical protein